MLVKAATGAAGRARLAREADRLRRLEHLAVVRPLAHEDDGSEARLVLGWVGPHSLATVAGLSPESSAALVGQVAETVAGIHTAGLVHGSVRPDHVLLAADGTPVLTGLGHAAPIGAADPPGAAASPADDVAALGALLVELVQPSDPGALVPDRRGRRRRDAGVRGVLLTLADRATADDPAARPTAAALAADLTRLVPGAAAPRAVRATPKAPPGATGRSRVVAAGALVVLVGATAAGAVRLVAPDPARRSPPTPPTATVPTTTAPSATTQRSTTAPAPPTTMATAPSTTRPVPDGPAPDRRCPPVTPPAADVDGDGCTEEVRIVGGRVSAGSTTWVVGRHGDRPSVADWDCDGSATVALLRPPTGEVFVFAGWARPGAEITVDATSVVDGAERIAAADPDGDGCADLVAHRRGLPPITVALGSDR